MTLRDLIVKNLARVARLPGSSFDILSPDGYIALTPDRAQKLLNGEAVLGTPGCSDCGIPVEAEILLPQKVISWNQANGVFHILTDYPSMGMHIITDTEWDRMCDLTGEDDGRMHWDRMYSWVNDEANKYDLSASSRAVRGYKLARYWGYSSAPFRYTFCGFRPVIENLDLNALPSGSKDGDTVVVGTLYMDGKPVRVPQNPTEYGDIEGHVSSSKLEMREALDDPAYQVTGILDGDKAYCDRVLLRNISYEDIEKALAD